MPKAPAFVPKPAIEKLPLAVRKDIRDIYESEREDFETTISDLIGVPFKININAGEVWAYASEGASAGRTFKGYVEGFIDALKRYLEKYGDDGKEFFNQAVTQSELTLNANTLGEAAPTISSDVKDGVFRILFRSTQLGYNQSYVSESFLSAIEGVPREGFSLQAKNSIDEHWNAELEDLQKEIGESLAIPDIVLDPNFEEVYKALSAGKKDKDWHSNLGKTIYNYFNDGLKYQLERQGFKGDDMLQEGAAEILSSKTFRVRIVPKLVKGYCNEIIIEDGVAYLQTTADKWQYNTSEMGTGFIDLL